MLRLHLEKSCSINFIIHSTPPPVFYTHINSQTQTHKKRINFKAVLQYNVFVDVSSTAKVLFFPAHDW